MFRRTKVCTGLMLAFGGTLAMGLAPAFAQQQLERVEITGSSIRRVDAETALPITVLRVEELNRQGVTTVEQAVQRISANQSNFGVSQAIGATTGGKAEADLRGLTAPFGSFSNKTLVLLNGRRLANHAFDAAAVDLNAIPLSAIERIEVLRDGASSVYGTDAIGGVINFITRRDYAGLEIGAQTNQPQHSGGGDSNRVTLVGGVGTLAEQRFNLMGAIDYRKQKVLEAVDRPFAATGILFGDVVSGTSGTSFPGDLNGFEPTLPNCDPPASIPAPNGLSCRYDFTRDIDIIPKNEQLTGLVRGSFAITPENIVSAEYLHARNKAQAKVAAAPVSHFMPATSPFFPAGAPITQVPNVNDPGAPDENSPCGFTNCVAGGVANWRQVPAGKRISGDDTKTERLMVELQGNTAGLDYRAAIGRSENESTASVKSGYTVDSIVQAGVFNGLINPFGAQTPEGQAALDAAQANAPTLVGKNRVDFVDLRVGKDLFQMGGGAVTAAVGVEWRRERSAFEATDITGELPSLGIDPESDTSGSRRAAAVFAEIAMPITQQLELNLQARYDRYSDFGNTFNPKIGLRYQPSRQLLLRGSVNTGFRAPTLYEIYQPPSLTFTTDNHDDPLLCPFDPVAGEGVAVPGVSAGVVCGQQVLQRNSGPAGIGLPPNALEPEKSKTWTVGLLFEPTANVSVGIDLWDIRIRNLISGAPEQAIFGDPVRFADRFVRCSALTPDQRAPIEACANFPTFDPIAFIDTPNENLGELKTNGVDLTAAWRSGATPWGNFVLNAQGTYVNRYKYQRERGGEFINAAGRYSDNAPVFRWQHAITGTWSLGDWATTIAQRYKSSYQDQDPTLDVGSYTVWDATVTWTGIRNLTLSAGVLNVFDQDPPVTVQVTTFQRGYDPRFADPLGRTFLLRANYKFF